MDLYDFILPRNYVRLSRNQSMEYRLFKEDLEWVLFDQRITENSDVNNYGQIKTDYKLSSPQDPRFLRYIKMEHEHASIAITRLQQLIDEIEEVLELLNQELRHQ